MVEEELTWAGWWGVLHDVHWMQILQTIATMKIKHWQQQLSQEDN